jgi:hypothetical protein
MFGVEDFVIELSIEKSDHEHVLVGQLTPPGRALVEVQRDDTSIAASTETDELGSFRVEFLQGGRHRLKIKSEALVRAIETSWIDI